jgi:hypothetical protein
MMSLAETRITAYDDAAARKALAKAIKAHKTKADELKELRHKKQGRPGVVSIRDVMLWKRHWRQLRNRSLTLDP